MKNYLVLFLCSSDGSHSLWRRNKAGEHHSRREVRRNSRQEPRRSARLNSTPIGLLRSV